MKEKKRVLEEENEKLKEKLDASKITISSLIAENDRVKGEFEEVKAAKQNLIKKESYSSAKIEELSARIVALENSEVKLNSKYMQCIGNLKDKIAAKMKDELVLVK
eukprot:TRINITY_DN5250_c0_g2_i1.p1 TRINITY_DN5250_c0_g2~~TRINITY_DN5250_c0_g2_i1.p1  ORF type:complete len:106 (+),score=28.13 TRINITY_DN5250_c0_g2_i1:44-361(+)